MCRPTELAMSKHLSSKALILFLFLPWANLAHAQVRTSGQVSGTVVDPSGAAVVGATITLSRPATGFAQAVTSDEFGGYIFPVVQPGTYLLKVEANGFRAALNENVVVAAGRTTDLRVELLVGQPT